MFSVPDMGPGYGRKDFPIVLPNDNGIRPRGEVDECFYCRQKVGQPHGDQCVAVTKTAKVEYTFTLEVTVPHYWTKENIEFHRNESSWCSDNGLRDLLKYLDDSPHCSCEGFECRYIDDVDTTPKSKTTAQEQAEYRQFIERRFQQYQHDFKRFGLIT